MDQLTAVVTDEEEDVHVQDPVVNGADDQEIDCPDALNSFERQVLQLWLPARVGFRRRYRRIERLLDDDPQLEQFAANALGAPEPVLLGDPGDEMLNLAAESRAAESGA